MPEMPTRQVWRYVLREKWSKSWHHTGGGGRGVLRARLDAHKLALAELGRLPGGRIGLLGVILNGGREGEGRLVVRMVHHHRARAHLHIHSKCER